MSFAAALEKATSADFTAYVHPKLRPEVSAFTSTTDDEPTATPAKESKEVYPFLGVGRQQNLRPPSGVAPDGVVIGPSMPISGQRQAKSTELFSGLSRDMADFSSKRTASIMVGSRAGC
eukprot:CAMPEP_0174738536 /NCGR_PEP_ID=MMETSP1094-20130205/70129_1 /TAXON_ID=156173 /ORGANISM="Chrysochromulina brevifilum, Strain UTEX LB 985" /LENGTH=118 /DNA_ID=CAMNT_0015941969 /DNA_START=20 /DNA_END=376 /DNA_ORIENTATION=+